MATQGPGFGLGHTQGGQSKGPWRHLPPPLGPLVLRRGVQLSTPITNHNNNDDDREMRTNCNQKKKIQSLMLASIRRLLVGPYYCLFLQSGAQWGKNLGGGGGVNLGGERRKGGAVFPVNCSKAGTLPRTLGAEAAPPRTAPAPQSQRSPGQRCHPRLQASRRGSAADWRPLAGRTQPWARWRFQSAGTEPERSLRKASASSGRR